MPTDSTMEPETNTIDDYPEHWDATLMGEEFWRDAENWNKHTNDRIEADHDQSLHTRFPFNIGPEQAVRVPCVNTSTANNDDDEIIELPVPEKRSRRFSMSDALGLNALTGRNSSTVVSPTRAVDQGRHSRSRSRSRSNNRGRSSSVASEARRSESLIRSTLCRISGRKKIMDEEEELEPDPEPTIPMYPPDQATPANPLMEFRGGTQWAALAKDRRTLGLDVFWPLPRDEDNVEREKEDAHPKSKPRDMNETERQAQPTVFPIDDMFPLCMFRNLRVLKITGMMQSYQMYIFQAAWLNTNLEELEIGMALPPRLRRGYKWPYIKSGWQLNRATYGEPVYYGTGEGSLMRQVGCGEYLDKMCLEKAKIRAMAMGSTRHKLSIRTLVLTGVVVDADPFLHWFDPKRLKRIHFKDNCVDSGFYLPHCMKKVSILFPRVIDEPVAIGRLVDPLKELKVIELKGGKKVGEIPFRGPQSLKENIPLDIEKDKKEDAMKIIDEEIGVAR
ncbi:hypothetical protein BJX61DRAFT_366380 [Aspergillus egyptiacus]|nr:hypothetical protein BJX61DRAFT_366380 [Aspergillus egyptiacus]